MVFQSKCHIFYLMQAIGIFTVLSRFLISKNRCDILLFSKINVILPRLLQMSGF